MIEHAPAAAAAFDVEAATRAYLATLGAAARARSDAYFEGGYWLLLWDALISVLASWLMLRLGWSAAWSRWASRVTRRRWPQPALYAVPLLIVSALITLPWTIYESFLREKRYGLMNQGFGGWLGDQATALAVTVVLGAIVLVVIFAVIRNAPRTWWLWGTAAMVLFTALGALIAPVFIAPLFNHYTPMQPGPLRSEILAMARANHIPADNVYVFNASKQSKRISANVSGIGPTIRLSLNDNLLNRTTPAEVKAVMGHEMGHYVLGHSWKLIAWFGLVYLGLFLLLWWLSPRILAKRGWGVRGIDDPAATPLFAIVATLYLLAMTPVTNGIVRHHEAEADAFGLDAAREPDGFAAVAMQLSEYRKIDPSPVEELLFFDHPSGRNRVHRAMAWKAAHLAELPPGQRGIVTPPAPPVNGAR